MLLLDPTAEEPHVNAAVYGHSGTGKTSFGVSAPKPLILLSERQGFLHVQQAAHRQGKDVPPVIFMQDVDDYRNVARALRASKAEPFRVFSRGENNEKTLAFEGEWPETVVFDSLSDFGRLLVEEIRAQSPPKIGNDGLPSDSMRFWGVLVDRFKNMILAYRDAPVHTVFLCLADDRDVGDENDRRRQLGPSLNTRKLPDELAAACNVVAYTYRKQRKVKGKPVELEFGLMTAGPEYMLLKPYRPLRDREVPDFSYWVDAIRGALKEPRPAPSASYEGLLDDPNDPEEQAALEAALEPQAEEKAEAAEPAKADALSRAKAKKAKKKAAKKAAKKAGNGKAAHA